MSVPDSPPLHANLNKVSFLIGKWRGQGKGKYATIKDFEYSEEISFAHAGRPFFIYNQKTWAENGSPLHVESGYLRVPSPDRAELVLAQPTGISSIEEGTISEDGKQISLKCQQKLSRAESAKHPWVVAYNRSFNLQEDGTLRYTMDMQTENQPMQRHLECVLTKIN